MPLQAAPLKDHLQEKPYDHYSLHREEPERLALQSKWKRKPVHLQTEILCT